MTFDKLFKRITIQTVIGGLSVYIGAKEQHLPDSQAIPLAIISAASSVVATAHGAKEPKANGDTNSNGQS